MKLFIAGIAVLMLYTSCAQDPNINSNTNPVDENPPAEGFNLAESDSTAIYLADEVMKAMGGRKAWDNTRHLTWNFFGARKLWWDKYTGNVRIEGLNDDYIMLYNTNSKEGRVQVDGEEYTHPDSLDKYLPFAEQIWINDSYWLVMPFKLKDSGVTLKYMGEDSTNSGIPADVVKLTFEEVGYTPENKYHVYISKDERLVRQWEYYSTSAQDTADMVTPWNDYKKHGEILLSGDRGKRQISEIAVFEDFPEKAYTDFSRDF